MSVTSAVINFAYCQLQEIVVDGKKKFKGNCKFCSKTTTIVETAGTTTGFVKHLRRVHKQK